MPIVITIKVKPSSGKQLITLDKQGAITCFLKSPPEDGKANHELIKLFSKKLGVTQVNVSIITGHTGRTKVLKIVGLEDQKTLFEILGLPTQHRLD